LLCLGRHTVAGLLTTSGSQFRDWSAGYRLFSQNRLPVERIFSVVRRAVLNDLPPNSPLCAVLDDSLLRRFQTNLVRAQRFLQISLATPGAEG
jgi:hypothetical protein